MGIGSCGLRTGYCELGIANWEMGMEVNLAVLQVAGDLLGWKVLRVERGRALKLAPFLTCKCLKLSFSFRNCSNQNSEIKNQKSFTGRVGGDRGTRASRRQ